MKSKSEDKEQIEFVSWFKKNYPNEMIIHIPNGKKRSIIDAVRLKAMGTKKGVPDLFFPEMKLWIEMKKEKGGKLSPEQAELIQCLRNCGYTVGICNGCEEAKTFILYYKSLQCKQNDSIE
ncbi:hypothetical protein [Caudoviricetes sp.]|nr:hypothetical protein [Caudoviricetes sp.]